MPIAGIVSLPIVVFIFLKIDLLNIDPNLSSFKKMKEIWIVAHSWERWIFGIDAIFFSTVIGTWVHSGLMFNMMGSREIKEEHSL